MSLLNRDDVQILFNDIVETIKELYTSCWKDEGYNGTAMISALKAVDKMDLYLKGDFITLWRIQADETRHWKSEYYVLDMMERGFIPTTPPSPKVSW